ncbi:MAG: hypothetical protein HFJ25_03785 [Clostridia bacterium]|nr:hypothetical protein [Clostridia bacterium]
MISNEFSIFLAFILIGIIISLLFDFFRILRRVYQTPDFLTIIEDIAFWIISGIILLSGIFILNEGKIRAFLFIGLFTGILFYIITLSKTITKIGINLLKTLNKIFFNPIFKIIQIISKTIIKLLKKLNNFVKNLKFDVFLNKKIKK